MILNESTVARRRRIGPCRIDLASESSWRKSMTEPTENEDGPESRKTLRTCLIVAGLLFLGCLIFVGGCAAIFFMG
jgi:hypothetical protein